MKYFVQECFLYCPTLPRTLDKMADRLKNIRYLHPSVVIFNDHHDTWLKPSKATDVDDIQMLIFSIVQALI